METVLKKTIIGVILLIIALALVPIANRHIFGNKQFFDFKQNFNTAYILSDGGKFEKVRIKAWKDYENSDSIQVIIEDGTPIYTHLRNVKLTKE